MVVGFEDSNWRQGYYICAFPVAWTLGARWVDPRAVYINISSSKAPVEIGTCLVFSILTPNWYRMTAARPTAANFVATRLSSFKEVFFFLSLSLSSSLFYLFFGLEASKGRGDLSLDMMSTAFYGGSHWKVLISLALPKLGWTVPILLLSVQYTVRDLTLTWKNQMSCWGSSSM